MYIPYCGRAFVAFGIQHAIRTRYIVVGDMSVRTLFFYIISIAACASENVIGHKMRVLTSLQRFV